MHVSVLEFLADGARCFGRTGGLEANDLYKLGDAAEVVLLIGFGGKVFDGDGDGRKGFLLET